MLTRKNLLQFTMLITSIRIALQSRVSRDFFLILLRSVAYSFYVQEFQTKARVPDCPLSLYEGWSGTVCFLLDLLQPDKAAFPFSDVFL